MRTSLLCALLGLGLAATPAAHATLIGDSITLTHAAPSVGSVVEAKNVTVQAGSGDLTGLLGNIYYVNPEASSIGVTFNTGIPFNANTFNGLIVSGINDTISSLSVATDIVGWTGARLTFDAHTIYANWAGLNVAQGAFFNLSINPSAAVPDAGSMLAPLALVLAGLIMAQRRRPGVRS